MLKVKGYHSIQLWNTSQNKKPLNYFSCTHLSLFSGKWAPPLRIESSSIIFLEEEPFSYRSWSIATPLFSSREHLAKNIFLLLLLSCCQDNLHRTGPRQKGREQQCQNQPLPPPVCMYQLSHQVLQMRTEAARKKNFTKGSLLAADCSRGRRREKKGFFSDQAGWALGHTHCSSVSVQIGRFEVDISICL